MRAFNIKVLLLAALFAALVFKGGQLCTADGVQAMTRLVEPARTGTVDPLPPLSIQEDFRGVSPLPKLADRAPSARKLLKPQSRQAAKKPVKQPQSVVKPAPKKPAGKG